MQYRINVGDAIPEFHAKDAEGEEVTSEDLFGTPVVIYFYPKDDTPGCTKEACSFRDNMHQLTHHDISVIGISPDSSASHRKFIQKHNLNFVLLSDPNHELCKKFDVIRLNKEQGKETLERSTFLVDRDGIIRWLERPVQIEGHVERIIASLKLISNNL